MAQIREILAVLNGTDRSPAILAAAAMLAKSHGARMRALHVFDPTAGMYVTPEIAAAVQRIGAELQAASRERDAEAVAAASRSSGTTIALDYDEIDPARAVLSRARLSDLVVIGQPDPDDFGDGRVDLTPRLLVGAATPVLSIPYAGEFPSFGRNALIAWTDSRESARALRDALPLLAGAAQVTVARFVPAGQDTELAAAALGPVVAYLAAHGVTARASIQVLGTPTLTERLLSTVTTDATIAELLLSLVADTASDLIVMGGYGHARAFEQVLGGVTRTVLRSMTVPVLMSH